MSTPSRPSRCAFGVVLSLIIPACTGLIVHVRPEAAQVEATDWLSPARRATLVEKGRVRCQVSGRGRTYGSNRTSCINQLRNEAHKIGGSVVVLDAERDTNTTSRHLGAWGIQCRNCVSMGGLVWGPAAP